MDFINFFKNNWESFSPIFLAITGFLGFYAKKIWLEFKSNQFKLEFHSLFDNLRTSINDLDNYSINANREVFRDMVSVKFRIWLNEGEKLAIELDKKRLLPNRLMNKMKKWSNQTIHLYKNEWSNKDIDNVVITIFNEKHKSKIDLFNDAIIFISLNKSMYITHKSRCVAIFDKLDTLLIETKLDFLEICTQEKFNGRLDGLKFKGIPLSDKDYAEFISENK